MLTVHTLSHPGTTREINEDAVLWDADLGLIAVADGMGGHNAGEVAARLALDSLRTFLRESAETEDFTWPFGLNPKLSLTANRVMTGMRIANRRVFRTSEERDAYTGMGTTLVAGVAQGASLTFSSVGDSRIYELRDGRLRPLSRDDSWIVMLSEESGRAVSEFNRHPMRHVLTSVIGGRPEIDAPINEIALDDRQTILLCTDGVHGAVPDDLMASILAGEADLERAARRLVETALERDGKDNITVLLARYTNGA